MGTQEKPESMSVGHTESHLKVLKVDPNFMEEAERKKLEELYNKEFVNKSGWRKSFMDALNRGELKSVVVQNLRANRYVRKRRNALVGRFINARGLWNMAIFKVIHGIRAAKANLIIDTVSDKSLVSQLHEFQSRADSVTLSKIEAALELPFTLRSDEELRFIHRVIMKQVKHFSKFTPEQRIQFCRVMTFQKHGAGQTIIKQGHTPWNFYFLFSGQCDVVKDRTDGQEGHVRVHVVNSGYDIFVLNKENLLVLWHLKV
jgi:predicted lipoprotein